MFSFDSQAANNLQITSLLDLTCKAVADMIKGIISPSHDTTGKSTEEIRKTFNIVNDFTPEEEEQVRKENEWLEDVSGSSVVVAMVILSDSSTVCCRCW